MRTNLFKGDILEISKILSIKKLCVHAYVRTNYFKSRALKFFGITFVVRTAYMRTNLFKEMFGKSQTLLESKSSAYELLQVKSCQIFWHHNCCAYSVHAYEPLQRRYLANIKDICNQKVVRTCIRTRSSQELLNFLAS